MEPKDVLMYEVIVTREPTPGAWIIVALLAVIAIVAGLLIGRMINGRSWVKDGLGFSTIFIAAVLGIGFVSVSQYIQIKDNRYVEHYITEDIGLSDVNYRQSGFMAVDQDGMAVYGEVKSPGSPNPFTTPKDVTYRVFVYQAR